MKTKFVEIPEDELRKIHSRLDVQDQLIERLVRILYMNGGVDLNEKIELLEMLEESQNPFEVSDEH